VQVEGHAPDGQRVYFRARHSDVLIAIGGSDTAEGAPYEARAQHPDASYIPAEDGRNIIRRLWKRGGAE
jgi:hypothetical protein